MRVDSRGFTLIELLITIAIISILVTFSLGAVFVAQETARRDRTEAMISKLHNVIIDRWESYRTRRLSLLTPTSSTARLNGVRELMRLEMPDRYEDFVFAPAHVTTPALRNAYIRRLDRARAAYNTANATSLSTTAYINTILGDGTNPNESAECLHLFITVSMSADDRAEFKDKEVSDTNANGMPEFCDGWGIPIHWLRWAPGVVSDVQIHNPVDYHDPFDPYGLEICLASENIRKPTAGIPREASGESHAPEWGYAMLPYIFSAGPDSVFGIHELRLGPAATAPAAANLLLKNNHPYCRFDDGTGTFVWRGEPLAVNGDTVHFDNIHNHNPLGVR